MTWLKAATVIVILIAVVAVANGTFHPPPDETRRSKWKRFE